MTDNPHSKARRAARVAAVQALYQLDMGGEGVNTIVGEFVSQRLASKSAKLPPRADLKHFEDIVRGAVREQDRVDALVSSHLNEKWSLKRLDKTLRALMRVAVYEIIGRPDVPALVIIDQYVSVAGDFFDEKERAFVNGSLEKVAKDVRTAEFGTIGSSTAHG